MRVFSTADEHEVRSDSADTRASAYLNLAALIVRRVRAAEDALPAIEMSGTSEPCTANVNLELQTAQDHLQHSVVDGTGWDRFRGQRQEKGYMIRGNV